ncbi:MAG TPA: hypothetical protein DHU96_03495 [Actinobacteria bacterium]|nr:hypothetical protein [Actinomycetota bacterium]
MARRKYSYYDFYYEPTRPIEVDDGIKARSQRGAFAKNWWATRWIQAMERLVDSRRLARGRSYARKGQVRSIEESEGGIRARVQGSRPNPYKVTIQVSPLTDAQWEKVIDALAEQAIFTAQLLAGEMPHGIEQAFQAAGVSLFPDKGGDLATDCSCPDWSNPCKHVAAAHYILGERFDEDPFLLFRLRGRTQEQILRALRQRRRSVARIVRGEVARGSGCTGSQGGTCDHQQEHAAGAARWPEVRRLGRFFHGSAITTPRCRAWSADLQNARKAG